MTTPRAHINAIGTAVPGHDIHRAFIGWAGSRIEDDRERALFARMAKRSGIEHRWSVLPHGAGGGSPVDTCGFYGDDFMPGTAARMAIYADAAPELALAAIDRLTAQAPLGDVTHLVVASCTGFVAPGVDQVIARRLGLAPSVERTLVGFMGCYAAVAALRLAHHLVRSEPAARVLVVTVELSTLHLQPERRIEPLLAMLQFADGAAAALVTADPAGLAIERPFAMTIDDSDKLIRWTIGDTGFAMHLSGEVPRRIAEALAGADVRAQLIDPNFLTSHYRWAVHAGGKSILDAVASGLDLPDDALAVSRDVLSRFGNMSSATLLFVLDEMIGRVDARPGLAMAFGPGLAAEGFRFEVAA